jgi:hypothetical protein
MAAPEVAHGSRNIRAHLAEQDSKLAPLVEPAIAPPPEPVIEPAGPPTLSPEVIARADAAGLLAEYQLKICDRLMRSRFMIVNSTAGAPFLNALLGAIATNMAKA